MDIVRTVRNGTRDTLAELAAGGLLPDCADPTRVSVRPTPDPGWGDLAIDIGRLSGHGGLSLDRAVVARLADALSAMPEVGAAEIVGPCSIGVTLSLAGLSASLAACLSDGRAFGRGAPSSGIAVNLAPVTRPDAAGPSLSRARAAAVADALARLLAFAGYRVRPSPDGGAPWASAGFGRLSVGPWIGAGLPGDRPAADPAIVVYEAEQGVPDLARGQASVERIAVAPCRLSMPGARRNASLADALDLADGEALRFAMLARRPGHHVKLDPRAAADAAHANPLFDARYAHARACGVLRRAADAMPGLDLAPAALAKVPLTGLSDAGERALLRSVALYPDRIASAAALRDPSRVVAFLSELARAVHGQWKTSKDQPQLRFVKEEQRDLTKARLGLVTAAALVLQSGLGVLGVSAPEEMR